MIEQILTLFFPERCAGCTKNGTALCASCAADIPRALPIPEPTNATALFDYGNPLVRKAIWRLKYHHNSALTRSLVEHGVPHSIEQLQTVLGYPVTSPIVFVPIPQHYTKTFSRGFNQSRLIARWCTTLLPETTMQPLLKKLHATTAQAHTDNRPQRQDNLRNSMAVKRKYTALDKDTLYIVVDDVITTGSTITEASRALRAAGAVHIHALAVAHGFVRK